MESVWQVGVSDAESSSTYCICTTKEIAIRELFKIRDDIVADWKIFYEEEQTSYEEDEGVGNFSNMYKKMISNLSGVDYEKWENYPHSVPWIQETKVIDS